MRLMMMSPLLPAAIASAGQSPVSLNQILRAVRVHLDMEVGFISEFADGRRVFRHVESAAGKACIEVGGSDPLEESYCYWVAEEKLPRLIRDPADHPFTAEFPATKALPVGAHLSVPIRLRDGKVYGTFCCFSFKPDRSLTDRDLATIEAFAQLAAEQIQETIDSDGVRQAKLAKVARTLRDRDLQMVYQPALRLDAPRVEFVEALARFHSKPYQTPDRWFAAAAEVGKGAELELVAVTMALGALHDLPDRIGLSINVSPETILSADFGSALSGIPLDRLILEITEHETVSHYSRLNRALAPLRSQGLRVAVDDMGAGYSSLRHILQIRPDLIKLDMSLSSGIDKDPARRALASALISFAREIDSELVAEGVETEEELDALRSLGVNLVQGFLLGRPSRLEEQRELLSCSL
jgi:EAL domain-containing protein (putative c-di-GMP-specific phosphodiesterase class I)